MGSTQRTSDAAERPGLQALNRASPSDANRIEFSDSVVRKKARERIAAKLPTTQIQGAATVIEVERKNAKAGGAAQRDPLGELKNLEHVRETAIHIWGNPRDADIWLNSPHPELKGATPISLLRTTQGTHKVEVVLNALDNGFPI